MTRGEFLQGLAAMSLGVVGGSALISSCGGGGKEEATEAANRPQQSQSAATSAAADPCSDVSALTDTELTMRETLKYAAQTSDPAKLCDNCKFWQPPTDGGPCGTCQLIKGPITPKGYCTSWFAADA